MKDIVQKIDISIVLKCKQELMGVAIIWIFLFHSQFAQGVPIIGDVIEFGSHGVDVFFFLSAVGISCSLQKNDNPKLFFARRLQRIFPTLYFFLLCVHLLGIKTGWSHPTNLLQGICWYTTLGWWFNGMFSAQYNYFYEWYIPTLLVFYLVTPFLFKRSTITLILVTICGMLISLFLSYNHILDNLRWSIQRVPIFVSGLLFYKIINGGFRDKSIVILLIGFLVGIILLAFAKIVSKDNNVFLLSIYRCSLVFSMPMFLWLISRAIVHFRLLKKVFGFLGGISLQIYLLHIYNRPLSFVREYFVQSISLSIIITFLLVVILAYLISFIIAVH